MDDAGSAPIDMARLKTACLDLAEAWDLVASRLGDTPRAGSPLMIEISALEPAWGEKAKLVGSAAEAASTYVAAASQHLRAQAALLEPGSDTVITAWSLVRTTLEYCGRVGWLLEPSTTPGPDSATRRAAWYVMEVASGLDHARLSSGAIEPHRKAEFIKVRKDARAAVEGLFDAIEMPPKVLIEDRDEKWSIDDEPYKGLRGAAKAFTTSYLSAPALYDSLSSFTHPSVPRLKTQAVKIPLGDHTYSTFFASPETIQVQVAVACACVARAARLVAEYYAADQIPLDDWADQFDDILAWVPADPS